jgi:hypothetical protein
MSTTDVFDPQQYAYTGYLQTILRAPDTSVRDSLAYVEFNADDLAGWKTKDLPNLKQWTDIPARVERTDYGISLTGRFGDIRRMDTLKDDDPNYWVALGSLETSDERFPIDVRKYSVAEITYRCTTANAWPAWVWTYTDGLHVDRLPRTTRWTTLARLIPHFGFPDQVNSLIVRLYSTTRSTEMMEVQSIRFREMSKSEREACAHDETQLETGSKPKHYPVLDEFLPLGVTMDAITAKNNAESLGVDLTNYWRLALEDIVTRHHNCIALDRVNALTEAEWNAVLTLIYEFDLRVVPNIQLPLDAPVNQIRAAIERHVAPHVHSSSILAWNIWEEPPENRFRQILDAKAMVEQVDPYHPVALMTRHPSEFPLYAPFFAVSGVKHFTSHSPWDMAGIVRRHSPLRGGQHFWVSAPTFTYGTGLPEWNTSSELRLMLNLSFANGARGWFSHSYHNDPVWGNGSVERTLTGPFLAFSDLWMELDRRMETINALSPLLLQCEPRPLPEEWYITSAEGEDITELPEGVPPTSSYRLKGPDYNMYMVVSNDVLGMSSINFQVPRDALLGMQSYDITDFIRTRVWEPMDLDRHLEMFPGQVQVFVIAHEKQCDEIRDRIVQRLVEDDRHLLEFNLRLARKYGLNIADIEAKIKKADKVDPLTALSLMDAARDDLVNATYAAPAIQETKSTIIQISSALCACDGVLCRLMANGRTEEAREWGERVVGLARQVTGLRVDLRAGKGKDILAASKGLERRTISTLKELRTV